MADSTTSLGMSKKSVFKGKKFRVAMIGCGGISQTHMEAFKSIPEVEVVAAVDIDQDCLNRMQEKWGVPKNALFKDWKKMLAKIKPDGVDICTPNYLHSGPAVDAANAGCHIIVEKPMAMSPGECETMIAAAKANNVKLVIGFQQRYSPYSDFLCAARDNGEFGDIMFVKVQALRRRGIPNWGVFGQKELQGGGPMIDIGVHVIEAAHYFMGAPKPVAVSGNTWTYIGNKAEEVKVVGPWPNWDYKTYTVEDLAIGQVRFANGAIMQIESSFAAHIKEDIHNFTFMGTKGGGSYNPSQIFADKSGYMLNMEPGFLPATATWGHMFTAKLRNWVDGAMYGKTLKAPGEDGLAVQKILNGIYDSAAAGKEIKIK